MSINISIKGSDAQNKSVISFMQLRKIPFTLHTAEEKVEDFLVEELKKRGMSAMAIVVYQSRDMEKARVAYACADDLDPKAVVDSVLDCVALFAKDKEL